jgi:hypothetical protein
MLLIHLYPGFQRRGIKINFTFYLFLCAAANVCTMLKPVSSIAYVRLSIFDVNMLYITIDNDEVVIPNAVFTSASEIASDNADVLVPPPLPASSWKADRYQGSYYG